MIIPHSYAGKRVYIFGLGKTGLAVAAALIAAGAKVWCDDDGEPARQAAAAAGYPLGNREAIDWETLDALHISPGIPTDFPAPHPLVATAQKHHVPIVGDLDLLAAARPQDTFIGITGTNGKSTTTALVGHLFQQAGISSSVAGNIGTAALSLEVGSEPQTMILEVSSYQLALNKTPHYHTAALLNITPDHLDRHGGMAGYVAAKKLIFNNQADNDVAIVGVDTLEAAAIADSLPQKNLIRVSTRQRPEGGIFVAEGILWDNRSGTPVRLVDMRQAERLRGQHNHENSAVAVAIALANGIAPDVIAKGLLSFPGLAHRQEFIARHDGILFINDSKATNAEATCPALLAYDNIYWILGGKAKDGGIDSLIPLFSKVRHAFGIGTSAQDFGALLTGHHVPFTLSATLDQAVRDAVAAAKADATAGEKVVLLSPACASFDQFANFEARGDAFRNRVLQLFSCF